jgi:hypothetical protein
MDRRKRPQAVGSNPGVSLAAEVPVRWCVCFVLTVMIPLVFLFIVPQVPQNGLWWDMLMGAGMLAMGFMIAVPLISPRVWLHFGGDPRALRFVLNIHNDVSYAVLLLTLVHIVGLVIVDPIVIEYLKLSASWSMLAATGSAILLLMLALSSLYRTQLKLRYRSWRIWHVALSVAAMFLMAFHVVDAGFYANSTMKKAIFIVLAAGPSLMSLGAGGWHEMARTVARGGGGRSGRAVLRLPTSRRFSLRLVTLLAIFCLLNVFVFAIPQPGSRAEEQAHPCPESICG